ncbi:hypothetical protein TNCV_1135951 [Trichonephila clavipes]|nr:hypothetical protein TNCV_1135951 [Trichonephila clavipes]
MNHTFWCAVSGTHAVIPGGHAFGKLGYIGSLRRLGSMSLSSHSFGHFPRLAHHITEGYYNHDFYRINMVCDPISYGDLASLCCLVLTI